MSVHNGDSRAASDDLDGNTDSGLDGLYGRPASIHKLTRFPVWRTVHIMNARA